jgi:hypothetical protein
MIWALRSLVDYARIAKNFWCARKQPTYVIKPTVHFNGYLKKALYKSTKMHKIVLLWGYNLKIYCILTIYEKTQIQVYYK